MPRPKLKLVENPIEKISDSSKGMTAKLSTTASKVDMIFDITKEDQVEELQKQITRIIIERFQKSSINLEPDSNIVKLLLKTFREQYERFNRGDFSVLDRQYVEMLIKEHKIDKLVTWKKYPGDEQIIKILKYIRAYLMEKQEQNKVAEVKSDIDIDIDITEEQFVKPKPKPKSQVLDELDLESYSLEAVKPPSEKQRSRVTEYGEAADLLKQIISTETATIDDLSGVKTQLMQCLGLISKE